MIHQWRDSSVNFIVIKVREIKSCIAGHGRPHLQEAKKLSEFASHQV